MIVENISKTFEILTKAAKENTHFKVYNGDTILPRWHANNTQRMGPILAVADVGYAFQDMYDEAKWYQKEFNVTRKASKRKSSAMRYHLLIEMSFASAYSNANHEIWHTWI